MISIDPVPAKEQRIHTSVRLDPDARRILDELVVVHKSNTARVLDAILLQVGPALLKDGRKKVKK